MFQAVAAKQSPLYKKKYSDGRLTGILPRDELGQKIRSRIATEEPECYITFGGVPSFRGISDQRRALKKFTKKVAQEESVPMQASKNKFFMKSMKGKNLFNRKISSPKLFGSQEFVGISKSSKKNISKSGYNRSPFST
jgi:hypothetical protein